MVSALEQAQQQADLFGGIALAVLIVDGIMIILGGLYGFKTMKSKPSIISSSAVAVVLIICSVVAWKGSHSWQWFGPVIMCLLLTVMFAMKTMKMSKPEAEKDLQEKLLANAETDSPQQD